MSRWTNILACIHINTYVKSYNIEKYVKNILKDAPIIDGGEYDAEYFVNKDNGMSGIISYGDYKNVYQSNVTITIQGDLRYKKGSDTKKQYLQFINFILEQGWEISEHLCMISDNRLKKEQVIKKNTLYDWRKNNE